MTNNVPAPSWCATDGVHVNFTRTASCGVFSTRVDVINTNTGAIVGQVFYNYVNYAYTSTSTSDWAHQLNVEETSAWGYGVGSSVQGNASCSGQCSTQSSSFPPQAAAPNTFDNGDSFFNTTATASGAVGFGVTNWAIYWTNPRWSGPSTVQTIYQLDVRCDNATPGTTQVGCVFPDYVPAVLYSLSGPYPVVARHINDAQNSGLPGAYPSGTPLTRDTSAGDRNLNYNTACPSTYPRPAGYSCDEYPFESTHQGAYFSGGGPRTFLYCLIVLTSQSTGAQGFSVCMVPATENSGAGGVLGGFYRENRVIESDAFRVWITT